ncbi:MAG: hypothetical protein MJ204_04610 [Bacteroidales bacterium]|nr:hypothetical protein [Bacteroidales bacterium]
MKKILLVLSTLLFAGSIAFGQGTIKNNSYFNLTWIRPIMDYGTIDGQETPNNLNKYYSERFGSDLKHYSGALNVGANFYIHPISWLIDGFKAGLCVDFIDLGANYYRFKAHQQKAGGIVLDEAETFDDLTVYYSLNVGAIATISPMKGFYIDLTGKACPTFAVNYFKIPAYQTAVTANAPAFERRNTGDEWGGYQLVGNDVLPTTTEEQTGIGWGINYSFGFNLRFYKFSVGCEWLFGNLHYGYEDWDDQTVKNQELKVKIGMTFE